MADNYRALSSSSADIQQHEPVREFAFDALVGLAEHPKHLSSKYFYDDEGSRLFQEIMASPDYYPTDCEAEILDSHSAEILAPMIAAAPFNLVDLGAGDGKKTLILLRTLHRLGIEFTYVPIDISEGAMKTLAATVERELPGLDVQGLVCEYTQGVHHLSQTDRPSLLLFLGSNIGNFSVVQARGFLRRLWTVLKPGDHALFGFDLKKDIEVLLDAYNDPAGVTAAFNLNLLNRMNRELGAHFDLSTFRHFGTYNVFSGAMESYLVSQVNQDVRIDALAQSFHFDAWEPLHTEYSYKYLRSDVQDLAEKTGFARVAQFEDKRGYFLDALWQVDKE